MSVGLTTPSLFGLFQSPPSLEDALVVGISQSGQSPDLVEVLATTRRRDRPTVAITNELDSSLAGHADAGIDICARGESATGESDPGLASTLGPATRVPRG